MKTTADPMAVVQRRYEHLVDVARPSGRRLHRRSRPLQGRYVVELLEGIQTLFAGAPVTYVVAADSCWLRESFLQVYEPFATSATGPGPMLGYGFLDKSFQLSTVGAAHAARLAARTTSRAFWAARRGSRAGAQRGHGERVAQVRELRGDSGRWSPTARLARTRSAEPFARRRLSGPPGADIVAETESPASGLRGPPRAQPAGDEAARERVRVREPPAAPRVRLGRVGPRARRQRLALWTIVKLRWPAARRLPRRASREGRQDRTQDAVSAGSPKGLGRSSADADVRRVVGGDAAALDVRARRAIALRAMVRPAPRPRPAFVIVLVDGRNVQRSRWPNVSSEELVEAVCALGGGRGPRGARRLRRPRTRGGGRDRRRERRRLDRAPRGRARRRSVARHLGPRAAAARRRARRARRPAAAGSSGCSACASRRGPRLFMARSI